MARKKNPPKVEPTAIVHTRALLIKQSEELAKLVVEQQLNFEKVKIGLLEAENAYNVVQSALARLSQNSENVVLVAGAPPTTGVQYVSEEKAQLHNIVCALMKKGGKWRPTTLRKKALEVWKDHSYPGADPPSSISYDYVQQVLANLMKANRITRLKRGSYIWVNAVPSTKNQQQAQAKTVPRGKKKRRALPKGAGKARLASVERKVARQFEVGDKYTAAQLYRTICMHGPNASVSYIYVWNCINRLVKAGKVVKVAKGVYQLKTQVDKVATKKSRKSAKKSTKVKGRRGRPRTAWMNAADKILALHVSVTVPQLQDLLKNEKHAPTTNAISKYVNRQVSVGNLKRVKRGWYATVDG